MTGRRAPLEPSYSKTGKPDRESIRRRAIDQDATAASENVGAGNRVRANDRPYQGVTRAEPSHYLWAHALWGEAPSHHHKRSAKRARRAR